jgi:hypothetical protein
MRLHETKKKKNFCLGKEIVPRLERKPTMWEKIFVSYMSYRRLITRMHRSSKKKFPKNQQPNE